MTDIVERLREDRSVKTDRLEAADTIEALRAENAQLKDALLAEIKANVEFTRKQADEIARLRNETLEEAATIADQLNGWGNDKGAGGHAIHIAEMIRRAARAAMGESDD